MLAELCIYYDLQERLVRLLESAMDESLFDVISLPTEHLGAQLASRGRVGERHGTICTRKAGRAGISGGHAVTWSMLNEAEVAVYEIDAYRQTALGPTS
ncbi:MULTISPECIES: hypothetical protein [Comamonadaceae]|uniref:hypothetical protein n=1 Tax=Acidovorax sacchari TaxID=3230736 RepID=UPI0034A21926